MKKNPRMTTLGMMPVVQKFVSSWLSHQRWLVKSNILSLSSLSNQLPAPYLILSPEIPNSSDYREHGLGHNGIGFRTMSPFSERCDYMTRVNE